MRLKELRLQKGVTQQEVAREIGCSANNYARYERGEREPDCVTLKQLSKFFGVSIDYILYNDWETQSDLLIFCSAVDKEKTCKIFSTNKYFCVKI